MSPIGDNATSVRFVAWLHDTNVCVGRLFYVRLVRPGGNQRIQEELVRGSNWDHAMTQVANHYRSALDIGQRRVIPPAPSVACGFGTIRGLLHVDYESGAIREQGQYSNSKSP